MPAAWPERSARARTGSCCTPAHPSRQTYYLRLTPESPPAISLAAVPGPALDDEEAVRANLIDVPNILMIGAIIAVAIGSAILAAILLDGSYALFRW